MSECPVKSCTERYGFWQECEKLNTCNKRKAVLKSIDKNELPPLKGRVTDDMLKALFGDMACWQVVTLRRKDGKPICYWCKSKAVTYAIVNYVGNVHKIPACAKHRKSRHGLCTEGEL